MDGHEAFIHKIKYFLNSKNLYEANNQLTIGLEKFPNQLHLLIIATEFYRATNNRARSLECAELLISHHPDNRNGYLLAAQDLVALKRFDDAQKQIQAGLKRLPKDATLLTIAIDVFRKSNNCARSLECAELLIIHHPQNWYGYVCAVQHLIALDRVNEALNRSNLLKTVLTDINDFQLRVAYFLSLIHI